MALTAVVTAIAATVLSAAPAVAPAPAPAALPRVAVQGVITTGLDAPWGLAFLPDGSALVSERDSGRIVRVPAAGGRASVVGRVRGMIPQGEGGLLGIAVPPGSTPSAVFAYITTARDNRVVRISWNGQRLGDQRTILTGIPKNVYHNGGRIAFGPDGMLYVATGDAGVPALSQQRGSLAGKILRITPTGQPAPGNPSAGSPVFSLGHRNVQGLAFDGAGNLWASEFGERDVDELNLILPGRNYGWPLYEGAGDDPRYVDPQVEWSPTSTASPSGMAILDDVAYVASLRGQALWQVDVAGERAGQPRALRLGDLGRLRTVAVAPDGSLWLMTNNTDGRGDPRPRDDRILRLTVR
jgi:glucose/arabinose dehydrogenase